MSRNRRLAALILLWLAVPCRAEKLTERFTLKDHDSKVLCLSLSPDGKTLATGDGDGNVYLWEWATGKELSKLKGHEAKVESLAWSPNGKTLATAARDETVRL